ncbi:MAG: class I SAM-dependent methyltransferase [Candidatus Sericytochromatia bacterium]|nr:class I SAM-dependent methyltransferase [Candidatus Tanganyikabacteria bacterium]
MSPAETPYSSYAAIYDRSGQSRFGLRMLLYARRLWGGEWPRSVLDLGCGTGAVAVALSLRDVRAVGVDRSPEMLARARARAARWGARAEFVQADYRDFALEDRFEAVTCFYDAINYCHTPFDLERVFRQAHRHARTGGTLFFDAITHFGIKHAWGTQTDARVESDVVRVWKSTFEPATGCGRLDITYLLRDEVDAGLWRRFDEEHVHRGYDPVEVHAALRSAGWEPRETFVCFTEDPVTMMTYRVAYLAIKRG